MCPARRPPDRSLPDLGEVAPHVRLALEAFITRSRHELRRHGRSLATGDWLGGFLEGLYAAGGLPSRSYVNRVAAAIRRDVLDTLTESQLSGCPPPRRARAVPAREGHR